MKFLSLKLTSLHAESLLSLKHYHSLEVEEFAEESLRRHIESEYCPIQDTSNSDWFDELAAYKPTSEEYNEA